MIECSSDDTFGVGGISEAVSTGLDAVKAAPIQSKSPGLGAEGSLSYAKVLNGFDVAAIIDLVSIPTTLHFVQPNFVDGRVQVCPPLEVAEK